LIQEPLSQQFWIIPAVNLEVWAFNWTVVGQYIIVETSIAVRTYKTRSMKRGKLVHDGPPKPTVYEDCTGAKFAQIKTKI